MPSIIKKLKANSGYILIGIGVLILLAEVIRQPYAIVDVVGVKIGDISQSSAIRLFVGIVLVLFGIFLQYKTKKENKK